MGHGRQINCLFLLIMRSQMTNLIDGIQCVLATVSTIKFRMASQSGGQDHKENIQKVLYFEQDTYSLFTMVSGQIQQWS